MSMLEEAYAPVRQTDAARFDAWRVDWREFDDFVYGDASSARNWLFFSRADAELVGFASWDPRQRPVAQIGHNCILPLFRGNGYGVRQLCHALDVMRGQGFQKVVVQTGTDAFFAPARAMYERAGFNFHRQLELSEPVYCSAAEYELVL